MLGGIRCVAVATLATAKSVDPALRALDDWRVGWELIDDWDRYQCFGLGRAAIVQFSRGCPHQCNYCGQYQFWERWRHRSPKLVVDEIEALHREHGIAFITLADENPTSSKKMWRAFLEELASRHLPIRLFATLRAADVVRDAEMLHLYRGAGLMCILMGVETTDPETLAAIRKGSTTATDREAVRLLRQHGILSMLAHIVGFEDERFGHYWRALRQLFAYDPDLLNAMYVTPHRWSDWVWFAEVWEFMFATQFARVPDSLRAWFRPAWKAAGAGRDEPIRIQPRVKVKVPQAPVSKPMALGFEVEQVSRNKAGKVRPTV
ncbi:magnesium-protoporphyrin IX monomethyl ester anaerobic oxidative cyclase [Bordetella ansorpii]|uniref:Magnesium-protoporphyrin IX monomethyl ester anaerobic oxidative cyclase n=1 Tax=Bordetella ansorpii TaxID=288768 RepID=A0A157S9X9_9BORD|nr:radical SAM protein [Bordetella ansorpii]SAI66706.1 magnesium-protoporphyrin IX monomethyl ester anaerobic oxidative cyclase [Bordetella ansorpii]